MRERKMSHLPHDHVLFVCLECRKIYEGYIVPPSWLCQECGCRRFQSMRVNPMPSFKELREYDKALSWIRDKQPSNDITLNDLSFLKEMCVKWEE